MIQDTGLIGDWLLEWQEKGLQKGMEKGLEQGLEQGREQGREQGLERGKEEGIREMTLRFLKTRFGELPEPLVQRVQTSDIAWCQNLFDRAITASNLSELTVDATE